MAWVNGYTLVGLKNKVEVQESNINYLNQRLSNLEMEFRKAGEFTGRLLKELKLKNVTVREHQEFQKLTKKEMK